MDDKYKKLGLKIAYYRKVKGYTQSEFAEKLGVSRTHISNIEAPNGKTKVSLELLFRMAECLDIDIKDLF